MGFRLKLIVSYAVVIFLTLVSCLVLFSVLVQQIQQQQRKDAEQRLARQTLVVQDRINRLNNSCPPGYSCRASLSAYRELMVQYGGFLDARILMIDERKTVQIDTTSATSKNNLQNNVLEGYNPVARDNLPHYGSLKLNEVNYIYYALPGPSIAEDTTGETRSLSRNISQNLQQFIQTDLVVGVPEANLEANWNNLVGGTLLAGGLALILSAVAAFFIARGVARPLIRMTRASEAITQGDYSQQLPEPSKGKGKDEMGRLAVSFNRMAREVDRSQQTMRDFVANVSHELKTPLTSIQGFSQAILDGTADDRPSLEHSAAVINQEAARMRRLVDELLDLSRIESGQVEWAMRELDLEKLLARVITKLGPQAAEKRVIIRSYLQTRRDDYPVEVGPIVRGDADRLEQIFTNILDNAVKYSSEWGEVGVKLHLSGSGPEVANKTAINLHSARLYWAVVEINNRGPLIPAEQSARIFERFYKLDKSRAKRRGESTGLGLAIAKELIEAHKGTIVVTSQPLEAAMLYPVPLPPANQPEGITSFAVYLPVLAGPISSAPQPSVVSHNENR